MNITRRAAIRNCFIITLGSALVPACMQDKSKSGVLLKNLKLDANQEALITELSETIIPHTDTPGSKDTYTPLFIMKMLDDMYTKDEQDQFVNGLKDFEKLADKKYNASFVKATPAQRDELLSEVMISSKDAENDLSYFTSTVKKLTIQGYMTSQYFLTSVRVYKLVPGRYYGCVPVTSLNKKAPSI